MLQREYKKQVTFVRLFKMFDTKDKWISILGILFVAISAICDIVNPYILGNIMNALSTEMGKKESTMSIASIPWTDFGIMIGLAFGSIICQILAVICGMMVATKNTAKFRSLLFAHTRYLASQDINEIGAGSILTRLTSDVTQLEQFLINYNTMIFKGIFFVIGGFTMSIYQLASYDSEPRIWFAALAYIFVISFVFVAGIMVKRAMPYFDEGRRAVDSNNVQMQENIVGNKLIRSLNLQKKQEKKYNKGNKHLFNTMLKSERIIAILQPLVFLLVNIAMVTVYAVAGTTAWNSTIDISSGDINIIAQDAAEKMKIIGIITSFGQYLMYITLGLVFFATFGYIISRAKISSDRIFSVLDKETSIKESNSPKEIKKGSIEFKNVFFKYEKESQEKKYTLSNISFKIEEGKSLGIIGQTGSGKSSLIKLLTRLYEVDKGNIFISGTELKDISLKSLRDSISVSLQEKVILKGTFKSNILIGKTDATDKEIIEAAKNAEAWEYISLKEDGIDGKVEERGSNLSGGQKQRLSIARALIKKSKILVIDDSTSALDTITERKILENLNKKYKGVTKIIISQKVKSIQNCDNIIVLDQGKIVQQGTHDELLKNKTGIYRKISDSQKTSLEG